MSTVKHVLANKYDVLIIDSATLFRNGVLEFKNQRDKRGGNSFTNWIDAKSVLRKSVGSSISYVRFSTFNWLNYWEGVNISHFF